MSRHFQRDFTTIYKLNRDIFDSRARLLSLTYNNYNPTAKFDKKCSLYIETLRSRLDKLTLMRHDEIMRLYSNVKMTRTIEHHLPPIKRKEKSPRSLQSMSKSKNVKTPLTLKSMNSIPKDETIYPEGVTDFSPYDLIACYRKSIGKSTDFHVNPLLVGEDSIETLLIGLDQFTKEHNCTICFTDMDEMFDQSIFDAPCDVFDLNSIHLLISHILVTAHFEFELELDYEKDFARSKDTMRTFVYEFRNALSSVLDCRVDYIRIFSIEKLSNKFGISQIHFGITTVNQLETEQYVQRLLAKCSLTSIGDFSMYEVLRCVIPKQYECIWKPLQAYFQIEPTKDLDLQYNFDFRTPNLPKQLSRGNRCYYLPIGWYRFGINVKNQYGTDRNWFSYINARDEWAVAFQGTSPIPIDSTIKGGDLLANIEKDDRPGLYVTTHCTNGADRYALPFHVPISADKNEQFQIVFQCRIEPEQFTVHKGFVKLGDVWRTIDAKAIRPYGILVRKKPLDEDNFFLVQKKSE